jgi:hypothetical protein
MWLAFIITTIHLLPPLFLLSFHLRVFVVVCFLGGTGVSAQGLMLARPLEPLHQPYMRTFNAMK